MKGRDTWINQLNPDMYRRVSEYYARTREVKMNTARKVLQINVKRFLDAGVIQKTEEPPYVEMTL